MCVCDCGGGWAAGAGLKQGRAPSHWRCAARAAAGLVDTSVMAALCRCLHSIGRGCVDVNPHSCGSVRAADPPPGPWQYTLMHRHPRVGTPSLIWCQCGCDACERADEKVRSRASCVSGTSVRGDPSAHGPVRTRTGAHSAVWLGRPAEPGESPPSQHRSLCDIPSPAAPLLPDLWHYLIGGRTLSVRTESGLCSNHTDEAGIWTIQVTIDLHPGKKVNKC